MAINKAVEELEGVKTKLIKVRRIIFTPSVEVKDELKNTSIQITCLDEEGNVLKCVTSGDSGDIEDNKNNGENENENEGGTNTEQGGSGTEQGGSTEDGGNDQGGGNSDPDPNNDQPDNN